MKFFTILVCILSLTVTAQSNAAIIDFTDNGDTTSVNNNGQVTEWLDLSITTGLSFDDVTGFLIDDNLDEVIADPELAAGWRIASLSEVIAMTNQYFGVWDSLTSQLVFDYSTTTITSFINLFGDNFAGGIFASTGIGFSTQGFTSDIFDNDPAVRAAVQILGAGRNEVKQDWNVFSNGRDDSVGAWLVRDISPIEHANAPASIALFVLAIMVMLNRRRA